MIQTSHIGDKKGVTLTELLVVMAIIGIVALIGVPRYNESAAKGKVKSAANDLLQNMRLASAMAARENQKYLITFNEGTPDTYRIGFDGNDNNSLLDGFPTDGFQNGPVRVVDLQAQYGSFIQFGSTAGNAPAQPKTSCPACAAPGPAVNFGVVGPVRQVFNEDGSVENTGSVFFNHTQRGFTYLVRVNYMSGKIDLWKWDGDINNPLPNVVNNCPIAANPPVRYCGWTEIR